MINKIIFFFTKKNIGIYLLIFISLFLSSCFSSDEGVEEAKKELWIIEVDDSDLDSWTNIWLDSTDTGSIEEIEEEPIKINNLTQQQFIELDDITESDIADWEVEITWKTLAKVDKIIVNFSNDSSNYPSDNYTLKQFSAWDNTFMYRAFSKYETLDFWKNVYLIEAYSWDEVSKLELIINLEKEEKSDSTGKVEETYWEISTSTLPSSTNYGTPTELWNWKVTYSDLKWLEIKRYENSTLTCETLSQELWSIIDWWFYWNTCRPVSWEEWISFYVIRLVGDNYVYEKHYFLSTKWIYWVQELENWTWVSIDNIWEKNQQLKEKNWEYDIIEVADSLFKEILNQ